MLSFALIIQESAYLLTIQAFAVFREHCYGQAMQGQATNRNHNALAIHP